MRFIHTADWQLGMKAEGVGAAAVKVRDQRLATAVGVVEKANEFNADFLLIAGDTFEHNAVSRGLIRRTVEILAEFNGPVYLIPGNHDPFVPGSVWEHPAWNEKDNIRILNKSEPVDVPGGTLYPCPLTEKHSMADPTAWIDASASEGIAIGVAHGTVEGVHQDEPDYPIPRDAASKCGLDYLALGHWHSTATYADSTGAGRMAYSGTHEQTKFGERDSGNILHITIDEPGAGPTIEICHVGALDWQIAQERLENPGDIQRIRKHLDDVVTPDKTLVDLRLSGLLYAADQAELTRLHELQEAEIFLLMRIDETGLLPAPDDDDWLAKLPSGVVRDVAERLQQLSHPDYPEARPENITPEVAGRAILELYAFVHGQSR